MRRFRGFSIAVALLFLNRVGFSQLKLGYSPASIQKSSILELESSNQGVLFPRISDTSLINALNPLNGTVIYFIPTQQLLVHSNGYWKPLTTPGSFVGGTGINYNANTGTISNTGVLSVNGNTGAITIDTGYIASFSQKVRSLFSGTAPITYSNGLIGITQATTSANGYLSSADWNTFNNKASSFSTGNLAETGSGVLTITGGTGSVIGTGTSIQVKQATTSQNGFLSSTDWNTFNNKLSSIDTTNIANFSTKVRSLFSGTAPITYSNGLIGISQATTSTNGYLSSTDWNTFNSKGSGSVTSVSVVSANGVSGAVANPTTTPAITLTLGAITPTSVAATGTVTGSNLSGTNTGNVTIGTANGLSLAGQALSLGLASTSATGALSSIDWNTFNNKLSSIDTTNIANFSVKVRSLFSGTAPITYSNGLIGISQATTSTNGYLSSADWNTFNSKASSFSTGNLAETGSGVLTITGGTGSVIGAGTSIQVKQATTSQNGFLSSTDWNTFNNKLSSIDTTNIANFSVKVRSLFSGTAPITYSNGLIGISQATTSTNGYLSSTDWNAFNNKLSSIDTTNISNFSVKVRSLFSGTAPITYSNGLIGITQATTSTNGYLSSADWNTFNSKASSFSTGNLAETGSGVLTITGGTGSVIGAGTSIQVKQATTSQNGFLSSTDWNAFNNKLSSIDTTNISNFSVKVRSLFSGTAPITYSNGLIGISQATTSTNGYLSSTDWNTFNNKGGGSVTSVSVVSANGVSGSVATATTTPAITLTLGAITPTSVAATGTVTGSNLSGTNTGNVTIGTANGLSLAGQALSLGLASTSATGALSSTDWNTFNNKLSSIDTTNISNFSVKVRSLFSGTAPITYSNGLIGISQATTSTNGYLSSADWNTFNNKLSSIDTTNISNFSVKVRSLFSGTAPITYSNGLIGISQATTSTNGYLSSTDWNTFNNKGGGSVTSVSVVSANGVSGSVATATTTPAITLTLGAITPTSVAATGTVTGSNLSGTNTGNVTIGTANGLSLAGQALSLGLAGTSATGALSSTDWNTFNNKLSSIDTTNISNFSVKVRSLFSGTAPITYSNGLIGISQATTSTNGYLSSTDWNTFNNKPSSSSVWLLNGNAGTSPSTNFIGTTDNQDLVFKANNTEWARIVSSSGDLKIGSATAGTVRATQELVMRQDGDVYGSTILRLRNRFAEDGAIFETTDPTNTLIDFIFKTAASQRNIRYEARSTFAKAGTPSFHIGGASPDSPTLAVGDSYAAFNTNLKIGNYNTPTEALDVTGNVRFSGALMPNNTAGTSGQVLSSGGSGAAPTWISIDTTNISNFYLKVRSLHSVTAPLTYNSSTGLVGISQATTSTNGYLSSTDWNAFNAKGSGSVTSVSVVSANGVSGSVATATTTPAITLTLGAITPTSVAATGTVTGSNLSGTNTGNVTIGTANGLSLAGQALSLGLASTSATGALSSTDWNTFNNKLSSIDTTNISNFSVKVRSLFSGTAPITYSNGLIGITQATTSTNGYLSSTDWNTFNNKAGTSNVWLLTGNPGITPVTHFIGTTDNKSLRFRTNNIERLYIDSSMGGVGIGTSLLTTANPEKLLVNAGTTSSVNAIVGKGTINNYLQLNIQNLSNGTNASSDVVATADNGSETTNYVDMGINSSGNTSGAMGGANDAYFYNIGNNLLMGTGSANKSLIFMTGGTSQASNERMRIDGDGDVGIGVTDPANPLVVKDTLEIRRTGTLSELLFSNTAGTGDFRIGGDGGDIFWQGGGGRNLQMGSYWTTVLAGDRQSATFPSYINGTGNTGVLIPAQRDASVPLAVQANSATQTAHLTEWRNSSGTVLDVVDKNGSVGIGSSVFDATNPQKLLVNAGTTTSYNAIDVDGKINNYLQINVQNDSSGTAASSDIVASADNGNESVNFVDLGINSSGYSSTGILAGVNNGYLYSTGNDFVIGNATSGKSLLFFTGGTNTTNERIRITATGEVGINTTSPKSTLDVTGSSGFAITTTTASLTLDATNYTVVITGGTPTITLPAASTCARRIYVLVNQTATGRTVSSYIDFTGLASTSLAADASTVLQSNGTSWYRIR